MAMYQGLLSDKRFYELLLRFDEDLAAKTRAGRCRRCGGALHSARYRRKPRGVPPGMTPEYGRHSSFCCAVDGCRTRHGAPSLRFLGRKVYLATTVVLISAMRCGASPARMRRLNELVGVSRHTVARWRRWWRDELPATRFWAGLAGTLMPPVAVADLPVSLLERFAGPSAERLFSLLRALSPLSVGSPGGHAA